MDIRKFFKSDKPGGGVPTPKKQKQEPKPAPVAAAAAAGTQSPSAAAAASGGAGASSKGTPSADGGGKRGGGGSNSRKRKKIVVDSDDSDVEIVSDDADKDDDSDDDFEAMELEDESEDDAAGLADEDDEDDGGAAQRGSKSKKQQPQQPASKRAKPSTAAPAAAKGRGGSKSPAAKRGGGRGRKADRAQMVIDKSPGSAEKDKAAKGPGRMSGQQASQVAAPKSAAKPRSAASKAAEKLAELTPAAREAMRLVDAAAAQLPELDAASLTFAEAGLFAGPREEVPPPDAGSKEVPRGHGDAFTGKAFVFSGVLSSLYRDAATELVLAHGGRITGDVSGKTSFLVVGEQCSKRKFEKAKEKHVKVIDEDGLLALAGASAALAPQQEAPQQAAAAAAAAAAAGQQQQSARPGGLQVPAVPVMGAAAFHGGGAGSSRAAAAAAAPSSSARNHGDGALWVDRHKPTSAAELVGNAGCIATLRQWLHQWEDVHLRGATPAQPKQAYNSKPKDMSKKALLLAGPPGIGKTSSAHIIARELGFTVVEVNASDTRSKSDAKAAKGIGGKLSNVVREMVTSTALASASGVKRRQVLVMDEVDGMSGGDRGGVADLIATIKMSKVPIICICNDKYSQKLRSLKNHCLELDYRKPQAQALVSRMAMICRAEGLAINDATLRTMAEGAQCDLRLMLGQLQMARVRSTSLDFTTAKALGGAGGKDADMSPFNACSKLFEAQSAGMSARPPSIIDQLELVFADADLVPLLVQENYLNYVPEITRQHGAAMPLFRLRTIAKAADSISIGDVVNNAVRRHGQWGLMPFGALTSSVTPACYMRGPREMFNEHEQNFTRFSAWFGQNSHANKERRLLAELSCAMAAGDTGATCSRSSVRLDYIPALRTVLTHPLAAQGEAAIPRVIETMQAYCISREQYDFVLEVTKFKSKAEWAADPLKGVETKTKAAFTRTFNKEGLKPRTNTMVPDAQRIGKGGKAVKAPPKPKGRGRGGGAGEGEGDEGQEALAGDAEGGAALAEESVAATAASAVAQRDGSDEADDEDDALLAPEELAARMKAEGMEVQLAGGGAKAKGGRGGGGRSGGRGGGRSGGGRGRGRGK